MENDCLTAATLALTAANTDEQLEACVASWLPKIVQCLATSSDSTRTQIFELLSHVNRRLKSRSNVKLPLGELRTLFKNSENTFIHNFGMVYLKMGFARLPPDEQINEFYSFLDCVSQKGAAQRDNVFQSLLRTFAPSHNERARLQRFETAMQNSPRFRALRLVGSDLQNAAALCANQGHNHNGENATENEKPFASRAELVSYCRLTDAFLDFLLDFLLVPYTVPKSVNVDQLAPPCLSLVSYRRVLPGDIEWTPELIERTKSGIVQFLATCSLFNDLTASTTQPAEHSSDTIEADKFEKFSATRIAPHVLLAIADSRHHVVMAAEHDIRRIAAAVDWTAASLHARLFALYLGDTDAPRLVTQHRTQAARVSLPPVAVNNASVVAVTHSGPASQVRRPQTAEPVPKARAEQVRMPANTRIRLKLLPAFMRSPAFARAAAMLRVIFDSFYNEDCSNPKLKCLAMRALRFLIEHADADRLRVIGPTIRKELETRIRPMAAAASAPSTPSVSQPQPGVQQNAESVLRFLQSTLENAQSSSDASQQGQTSTQTEVNRLESLKLRQLAYDTLGCLFARLPDLLLADTQLQQVRMLFYTLRDAPLNDDGLRSAVQQCLLYVLDALGKLKLNRGADRLLPAHLNALEAVLFENAEDEHEHEPDASRALLVAQFASRLFPRAHVASKYLLLICAAHSRDSVRNEALRALAYPRASTSVPAPDVSESPEEESETVQSDHDALPDFDELVHFVLQRCTTERPLPVMLLRYAVTYARTCLLQRCVASQLCTVDALAEYVSVYFPVDAANLMATASRASAAAMHRCITADASQNELQRGALDEYVRLLQYSVSRMCTEQVRPGTSHFDPAIVYCLLEAVACGCHAHVTFEWTYDALVCGPHATVRELAAELSVLLAADVQLDTLLGRLVAVSLRTDGSSELAHGALLLTGHLIHRVLKTGQPPPAQLDAVRLALQMLLEETLRIVADVKSALQRANETESMDADPSTRSELQRELESGSSASLSASHSLRFHATLTALAEAGRSGALRSCFNADLAHLVDTLTDFAAWRRAPSRLAELTMRTLAHVSISFPLSVDSFQQLVERLVGAWCRQRGRTVDQLFTFGTLLVATALGRVAFERLDKWSQAGATAFCYDRFDASLQLIALDDAAVTSAAARVHVLLTWLASKLTSDDTYTRFVAAALLFAMLKRCVSMRVVADNRDACHVALINALLKESGRTAQAEADESTADLLSKALWLLHAEAQPLVADELRVSLIEALSTGRRLQLDLNEAVEKKRKVTFADATGPVSIDALATYRELCSLATALGRPDLVVAFLSIAHHQDAIWNTPRVAELFSCSDLAKFSTLHLQSAPSLPKKSTNATQSDASSTSTSTSALDLVCSEQRNATFDKLVSKLYRARFDPSTRTARSMQRIWRAVIREAGRAAERRLVDRLFDSLLNELLLALGGATWRVRESACAAFAELTRGRAQLLSAFGTDRLAAFWAAAFALLDDAKESVRRAADDSVVRVLRRVTLAAFDDAEQTSERHLLLTKVLPLLLDKGLVSKVEEVRTLSITMLSELVRVAGESLKPHFATLLPSLLEYLAAGESAMFNYLALHVAGQTGLHGTATDGAATQLDAARVSALKSSPLLRIINDAVGLLQLDSDAQVLRELIKRISELLATSATPTRCGCSETLMHLVILLAHQPAARQHPDALQAVFAPSMPKLAAGIVHVLAHESSRIVKQQFARLFGYLARFAKPNVLEQTVRKMRDAFLERLAVGDADAEADSRSTHAEEAFAEAFLSVARHSPDTFGDAAFQSAVVPFAFVALHSQSQSKRKPTAESTDEDESSWLDVLQECASGNLGALVQKHCDAVLALIESSCLDASSYCVKARGATALHRLISRLFPLDAPLSPGLVLSDRRDRFVKLLRLVLAQLGGRSWTGKHVLLECLGALIGVAMRYEFDNVEEFPKCYAALLQSCKKENVAFKRAALVESSVVISRIYDACINNTNNVLRSSAFITFLLAYFDIALTVYNTDEDDADDVDRRARDDLRIALFAPLALAFPPTSVHMHMQLAVDSQHALVTLWNVIFTNCLGSLKHGTAWRMRVEALRCLHLLFERTRFDITGLQEAECICPLHTDEPATESDALMQPDPAAAAADAATTKKVECQLCDAAKRFASLVETVNDALRDSHSNVRDAALNVAYCFVNGWLLKEQDEAPMATLLRRKHGEQLRTVLYAIARLLTNEQVATARSLTNSALCDKLLVTAKACLNKFESL